MIKVVKPYQISAIKKPSDFLIFTKNMFQILQKEGYYKIEKGYYTAARFCKLTNSFVLDNGTNKNRDVSGINKDNLNLYYEKGCATYKSYLKIITYLNKESSRTFLKKYNLYKNHTKFLLIYITEENFFIRGLYQFCQSKYREGAYCDCKCRVITKDTEFLLEIESNLKIFTLQSFVKIKDSKNMFKNFLDYLNNIFVFDNKLQTETGVKFLLEDNSMFDRDKLNKKYNIYKKKINILDDNVKITIEEKNQFIFALQTCLTLFLQSIDHKNIMFYDKSLMSYVSLDNFIFNLLEENNQELKDNLEKKEKSMVYFDSLLPKIF